MKEREENNTN